MRGLLIIAGLGLIITGLIWPWLGHLPGDLRFGEGSTRLYIPLGSSLLVSVLLSLLFMIVAWFLHR